MDEDAARSDAPRPPSTRRGETPRSRSPGVALGWAPILERHGKAALRFLQLALGDHDAAGELYRKFALELLHDDPPPPGPSRDLLGTALIRLINSHRPPPPNSSPWPSPDPSPSPPAPPPMIYGPSRDDPQLDRFDALWREEILARARRRLKDLEARTGDPLNTALRLRGEAPGLSFPELADRIGRELGRHVSADDARQLLHRARAAFAHLLLDEVVATLPDGSPVGDVERELIETGLLAFCREAFVRYRPAPRPGRGR